MPHKTISLDLVDEVTPGGAKKVDATNVVRCDASDGGSPPICRMAKALCARFYPDHRDLKGQSTIWRKERRQLWPNARSACFGAKNVSRLTSPPHARQAKKT